MKTPKNIEQQVKATFDVLDTIEETTASPFLKDKTMQRLFTENEATEATGFSWFTPKLQLATLVCVLLVNVVGILQLTKSEYNENISEFANAYDLSQEGKPSLFN